MPPDLPDPDRYRGRGTVYLGFENDRDGSTVRAGYWDAAPDSTDEGVTWMQDAGRHPSATSAVAWARERTSRVVIRLLDDALYWAGTAPAPDAVPHTFETGDPEHGTQNERCGPSRIIRGA